MIQRVQTIYLLLAAVFSGLMFFFPFIEMVDSSQYLLQFNYNGIFRLEPNGNLLLQSALPVTIIISATLVLSLVTIFLYKKRILQMRLCIYNILLLLGTMGLIYYYYSQIADKLAIGEQAFRPAFIFPLAAAILNFLAFRGIRRDEKLVRSYDRIR